MIAVVFLPASHIQAEEIDLMLYNRLENLYGYGHQFW